MSSVNLPRDIVRNPHLKYAPNALLLLLKKLVDRHTLSGVVLATTLQERGGFNRGSDVENYLTNLQDLGYLSFVSLGGKQKRYQVWLTEICRDGPNNGFFVQVPAHWLAEGTKIWKSVTKQQFKLLLCLISWADKCPDEYFNDVRTRPVAQVTLKEYTGTSEQSVRALIRGLEGAGLISTKHKFKTGNIYTIHFNKMNEEKAVVPPTPPVDDTPIVNEDEGQTTEVEQDIVENFVDEDGSINSKVIHMKGMQFFSKKNKEELEFDERLKKIDAARKWWFANGGCPGQKTPMPEIIAKWEASKK